MTTRIYVYLTTLPYRRGCASSPHMTTFHLVLNNVQSVDLVDYSLLMLGQTFILMTMKRETRAAVLVIAETDVR